MNGGVSRLALGVVAGLLLSGCETPEQYAARMDAQQGMQNQPQQRPMQPPPPPAYGGQGGGGYGYGAPAYPQEPGPWDNRGGYDNRYPAAPGSNVYPNGGGYRY